MQTHQSRETSQWVSTFCLFGTRQNLLLSCSVAFNSCYGDAEPGEAKAGSQNSIKGGFLHVTASGSLYLTLSFSLLFSITDSHCADSWSGDKREKRNGKSITERDVKSLPDEAVRRKEAAGSRQLRLPAEENTSRVDMKEHIITM